MAFTYNSLQALGKNYLAPRVTDNTFKGCPYGFWLKENGRLSIRGGSPINVPIIKAQLNSDWYSTGLTPATLEVKEPFTKAEYNWKFLRVPWALDETDILKNGGQEIDLMDATEQVATLTMIEAFSTALFGTNASASSQLDGLQNMAGATGTAYGGLTDTDFVSPATWLMNIRTLAAAGTLTAVEMRIMRGNATRGRAKPNLGLCNFPVYGKIWALAQTAQRFGMERIAKLGFDHMMFEDMPIMPDEHSTGSGGGTQDNWLYMLNTDYIKLVIHEEQAFKSEVYHPIPQQEVKIGKIKVACNQITSNRRMHSVVKTIDSAL